MVGTRTKSATSALMGSMENASTVMRSVRERTEKVHQYKNIFPRALRSRLSPLTNFVRSIKSYGTVERSDNPVATHLPVLVGLPRLLKIERVVELVAGNIAPRLFWTLPSTLTWKFFTLLKQTSVGLRN